MTTDEVPMVRTYPEMNAKIVGILRLMPDEAPMTNLYAAQRIEELEAALARSEQQAGEAEDTIRRYALEIEERGRIMNEQSVRAGEAEARAEAMHTGLEIIRGCESLQCVRSLCDAALSFAPPRAGEEEPPATATMDAGEVARLRQALTTLDSILGNTIADDEPENFRLLIAMQQIARAALTAAPPARRVDGGGAKE